jgi:hypothetical protein
VRITGPGTDSRIGIKDEENVDFVEAMLKIGVPADQATDPEAIFSGKSSPASRLHANRRIFITSLGDPTVPASFTRQLLRNQKFPMVTGNGGNNSLRP